MTEHTMTISARIEGDLVAIDVTLVDDKDYRGVLNTVYLDAVAAVRFGEGLAQLGRQVRSRSIRTTYPPLPAKFLPLAVPTDPHAEDER